MERSPIKRCQNEKTLLGGKAWVSPRTIYPNSKHSSGLKCSPCSKEFENSRRQDKILDFFPGT